MLLAGLQIGLDFHGFTSFEDLNENIPTTPTQLALLETTACLQAGLDLHGWYLLSA
jgi:hypothetical protein